MNFEPVRAHGGPSSGASEVQISYDFSVNLNYYAPNQAIRTAVEDAPYFTYPDPKQWRLRCSLASQSSWLASGVLVGNGATEILWLLAAHYRGKKAAVVGATFCEFAVAARKWCSSLTTLPMFTPHSQKPLEYLGTFLEQKKPDILYVCNPNSPCGTYLQHADLMAVLSKHPSTAVILDQAFLRLSSARGDEKAVVPDNVMRLRSLTKDFGIAGLRLGYLLASTPICEALEELRPCWSVNSLALAAGEAAVTEGDFLDWSILKLLSDRDYLLQGLQAIGLRPLPTTTIFFMMKVDNARSIEAALLARGIRIRSCASYGFPEYFRLGTRPKKDSDYLLKVLERNIDV